MDIIGGPAGSIGMDRMTGSKVKLAGRMMVLPDSENTFVRQKLTLGQIAAIPRDRYVVSVIESSMPLMSGSDMKKGRFGLPLSKLQRYRKGGNSGTIGLIGRVQPGKTPEESGSKIYDTVITLLTEAAKNTRLARDEHRTALRNQKNAQIPDSDIFFKPIDEDELSDCILKIIDSYFGSGDTCKIMGNEYKLAEFCVLMHFYFIRIGILENESRQPFCLYLINKVFGGHERFTVRTFNNYANEFEKVRGNLTHADWLKIDFNTRPDPSGKILQDAFHEIGFAFHHSHYFVQLRKRRNRMNSFLL